MLECNIPAIDALARQAEQRHIEYLRSMQPMGPESSAPVAFKPGDVVCLKSGSPALTFIRSNENDADAEVCYWDGVCTIEETAPLCALVHVVGNVSNHNRDWYSARNPVAT